MTLQKLILFFFIFCKRHAKLRFVLQISSVFQTVFLTSPSLARVTHGWPYQPASEALFSVSLFLWEHVCQCKKTTYGRVQQWLLMTASLTAFPSDMVFGVGLGCLVQMIKTHTDVEVTSLHKHRSWAADVVISDTWDCFGPCEHDASCASFSSSVWSRRLVDVGSCRISGFVFGAVLRHCSSVPVQDVSRLRDLSPLLLWHFPSHCTAHRVGKDPHLTLRPVWNQGCPPLIKKDTWDRSCRQRTSPSTHNINALFIQESTLCALASHPEVNCGTKQAN